MKLKFQMTLAFYNLIMPFGFKGHHMSQFKVPEKIPEEEAVDLNSIVETIEYGDFIRTKNKIE